MAEPTYKKPTSNVTYQQAEYTSKYQPQIDESLNKVTNWSYDPLKDASYKALANVYNKRGEQAAKNTMGDAASLNGGYGTSYAVTAANQARNDYNQELASYIPDLEEKAYNRNINTLSALQDAEDTSYNRYRDTISDNQWQYNVDYNKYRDDVSDAQWDYSQQYQKYRDSISDYQWAEELKKSNASSGSSGSSSGVGYVSSSGDDNPYKITDGTEQKKSGKSGKSGKTGKTNTTKITYKDWAQNNKWKSSR